jgi:hypothetical protein
MNVFRAIEHAESAIDEEEKTEGYYLRAIEHAESIVDSIKETIEDLTEEWLYYQQLESRTIDDQELMKEIEKNLKDEKKKLRRANIYLFTKTSEHFERFGRGTSIFSSTSECQPLYIDDEINAMLQLLESEPYDEKVKYTYEIKKELEKKYPNLTKHIDYAFKFYILSFQMVKEHDLFRDSESVPPLMIHPEVRSIHLTVQLIRFLCIIPDFEKALAKDDSLKNTHKHNGYLLDERSRWFETLIAFFVYYSKIRSVIQHKYIEELLVILSKTIPEINDEETLDLLKKRIYRLILLLTTFETFDSLNESNPSDKKMQDILKQDILKQIFVKQQRKKRAMSVGKPKKKISKKLRNEQLKKIREEKELEKKKIYLEFNSRNNPNLSSAFLSMPGGKKTRSKRKHKSKTRRI